MKQGATNHRICPTKEQSFEELLQKEIISTLKPRLDPIAAIS
jgi:hypothetical protein